MEELCGICTSCNTKVPVKQMNHDRKYCDDCFLVINDFKIQSKLFSFLSFTTEIDQINEKIWLGNEVGQKDKNRLKSLGITHILVAGGGLSQLHKKDFIYKQIPIIDTMDQDIASYFKETYDFIESSDKIFIHCAAGVSRSAAILIAYLMKKNKKRYVDMFNLVKEKRSCINPNPKFVEDLKKYEVVLGIKEN